MLHRVSVCASVSNNVTRISNFPQRCSIISRISTYYHRAGSPIISPPTYYRTKTWPRCRYYYVLAFTPRGNFCRPLYKDRQHFDGVGRRRKRNVRTLGSSRWEHGSLLDISRGQTTTSPVPILVIWRRLDNATTESNLQSGRLHLLPMSRRRPNGPDTPRPRAWPSAACLASIW